MKTYRLTSTGMCHTPGIVAWAIAGYTTEKKAAQKASFVEMLTKGYDLPLGVAIGVLSGEIPYRVEGDAVVIKTEDAE